MHPVVSAKLRDMDEAELRTAKKEDIVGLIQVGFWPVLSGCRMFLVLGFFFFFGFFFCLLRGELVGGETRAHHPFLCPD